MSISFIYPDYLYLLFIIPIVVFIHFLTLKLGKSKALKFANFDAIARVKGIDLYSKNISVLIITILIFCLIIFSLAGAIIQMESNSSSFSFVLAIDSSRSMEAVDIEPSRLDAAKSESLSFVDSVPIDTNIGVISFSGNSYVQQTVTSDRGLVKSAIKNIDFSTIGGTDINEAVVTSANLLEGYEKKAAIILSDGQINVGNLQEAIDYANKHGMFVHTIAIGTKAGGNTSYGISKLDEDSLKALAFNTQGIYLNAQNGDELFKAFSDISAVKLGKVSLDISGYLLLGAMFLIFLLYILINTRLRVFP